MKNLRTYKNSMLNSSKKFESMHCILNINCMDMHRCSTHSYKFSHISKFIGMKKYLSVGLVILYLFNLNKGVKGILYLKTRQKCLTKGFGNITKALSNITNAFGKITKDVSNITKGLSNITKNVCNITKSLSNITKGVGNITKSLSNITKGFNNMTKGVCNITKDLRNITKDNKLLMFQSLEKFPKQSFLKYNFIHKHK